MSTTTQILFNSPALHSLKRDQLVKLCKIHSIKASGKNVDLIQKLRQHAQTLPKDSPLSIAARSESDGPIPVQAQITKVQHEEAEEEEEMSDEPFHHGHFPRQSEQWEMVMDSIQEEEEGSSQGTLSSQRTLNNGGTGEFGTGSSKGSSVGSSIKALATSLGLKRGNSKASSTSNGGTVASIVPSQENDELALKSTPYSSLPESTTMPQTDHFTLDTNRMSVDGNTEIPLPGHALRPGLPAPANARLSMGFGLGAPATPTRQAQPTTTIRLVNQNLLSEQTMDVSYGESGTPQLKPFKTTFDLSFGSPAPNNIGFGFGGTSMWPPRNDEDVQMRGIYPTLTFDDLPPSVPVSPVRPLPKSPEPFMFGSPHPKNNVSNDQFRSAAAAVLDEMNQRLREDGVDEIELDIISKLHPGAKKEPPREIKPIPASKRGEITDKFQKVHEQEFQKMQGIDAVLKKRAERSPEKKEDEKVVIGRKRKSDALGRDGGPASRRPSALAGRASATRVISNGRRAKAVIPGAFGMDDDDEDEDEEQEGNGKRARMDPEAEQLTPEDERKQEEEELHRAAELEKEKEAIRKKLEANRARRRSSAAHGAGPRKSVGWPRPSVLQKPKPKPSRFGFLSSAKTLVQSVWNRGKPADAAPSNIPKPMPAKTDSVKDKMGPPSSMASKKSAPAPARPTTAVASGSKPPSIRVNNGKEDNATVGTRGSIASSSRSRSPLPSFNTTSRNSIHSNGSTRTSRSSLLSGPASRVGSVAGTAASKSRPSSNNVSSVGTRASTRLSTADVVSSMGAKKAMNPSSVASRKSTVGTTSSRLSSTSRLLAPTASSLAKAHRTSAVSSSSHLKAVSENRFQSPTPTALGMITNNPSVASPKPTTAPHNTFSPRQGGIFSTPLALPPQSGIPTPIKKRSPPGGEMLRGVKQASSGNGDADDQSSKPVVRSLNGRKPRISRSKVIARLASQRAATNNRVASGSSIASGHSGRGLAPRVSSGGGKTRSSIGAKVSRASYGGGTRLRTSAGGAGNVVLSAKKRARQSEYARRRSRVGPLNFDAGGTNDQAD